MSKHRSTRFGRRATLGLLGAGLAAPFIRPSLAQAAWPEQTTIPDILKGSRRGAHRGLRRHHERCTDQGLLRAVREDLGHQGARLPRLQPDQGQGDGRDRQRRMGHGPAQPRLDHEPAEERRLLREDRLRHHRSRCRPRLSLRVWPRDAGVGAGAGLSQRPDQGGRAQGLGRLLGHQEVPRRPRPDRHQRRQLARARIRPDGGGRAGRQALSARHRQGLRELRQDQEEHRQVVGHRRHPHPAPDRPRGHHDRPCGTAAWRRFRRRACRRRSAGARAC